MSKVPLTPRLVEKVSAMLSGAGIRHECFAAVEDARGEPFCAELAIPCSDDPLAVILCAAVEDY